MSPEPTANEILELARGYQSACVLTAAADLDVFSALADAPASAADLAARLNTNARATELLLNALAALRLLQKDGDTFRVPAGVAQMLSEIGQQRDVLAMVRHQGTCLRRWVQLPNVVQQGGPADKVPSVRGRERDYDAFIEAMHCHSAPLAEQLVAEIHPLNFKHLLDIGGASGTWTIAFLRAVPDARATLFDLPEVIPLAERRLKEEGLLDRVSLVAGDFERDDLPPGADFAWLGAIVHQNGRDQNRALFAKIHAALRHGGQLILRDVLMEPSHVEPAFGALFAINMLVGTEAGGTFDIDELREDLESAGFIQVTTLRHGPAMDSLVRAAKA